MKCSYRLKPIPLNNPQYKRYCSPHIAEILKASVKEFYNLLTF